MIMMERIIEQNIIISTMIKNQISATGGVFIQQMIVRMIKKNDRSMIDDLSRSYSVPNSEKQSLLIFRSHKNDTAGKAPHQPRAY